jgi:hypothetical protein
MHRLLAPPRAKPQKPALALELFKEVFQFFPIQKVSDF